MRSAFLAGAEAVLAAVRDPALTSRWDEPSALEDQTVGVLLGHLGRTGVLIVDDYLGAGTGPGEVTFASAAEYYAVLSDRFTPADHVGVRRRSADAAAAGPAALAEEVAGALERVRAMLPGIPGDDTVAVFEGTRMRVDDFLLTRVVEQAVHLDDLGVEPPPECVAAAIEVGAAIGVARRGALPVLRSLYRDPGAALPVL